MATYQTPGVYVEEVPATARPIEAVGTSTAGFLGDFQGSEKLTGAVALNNFSEFMSKYGPADETHHQLAYGVFGFFQNGGRRCYIAPRENGLRWLEEIDEIAILAAPGIHDPQTHEALLSCCERLGDRFAILDANETVDDIGRLKDVATVTAKGKAGADSAKKNRGGLRPRASNQGAFYFPWIVISDPLNPGATVTAGPSGFVAGVYARCDGARGVHKAPANEVVRGALGLTYRTTRDEQGELNRCNVNCLRAFQGSGIRIWGARTLADPGSEWRYVNVRRLANMIKESIQEGTRWAVFEPNNPMLWRSLHRDTTAFLSNLWRSGALLGTSENEAYFVKCDAEINPPEVIDEGCVITEIGVAPCKPAEFIVFRISQERAVATV